MNCLVQEMVGAFSAQSRTKLHRCQVRGLNELQQGFKGELTMSEHMEQLAEAEIRRIRKRSGSYLEGVLC